MLSLPQEKKRADLSRRVKSQTKQLSIISSNAEKNFLVSPGLRRVCYLVVLERGAIDETKSIRAESWEDVILRAIAVEETV